MEQALRQHSATAHQHCWVSSSWSCPLSTQLTSRRQLHDHTRYVPQNEIADLAQRCALSSLAPRMLDAHCDAAVALTQRSGGAIVPVPVLAPPQTAPLSLTLAIWF